MNFVLMFPSQEPFKLYKAERVRLRTVPLQLPALPPSDKTINASALDLRPQRSKPIDKAQKTPVRQ